MPGQVAAHRSAPGSPPSRISDRFLLKFSFPQIRTSRRRNDQIPEHLLTESNAERPCPSDIDGNVTSTLARLPAASFDRFLRNFLLTSTAGQCRKEKPPHALRKVGRRTIRLSHRSDGICWDILGCIRLAQATPHFSHGTRSVLSPGKNRPVGSETGFDFRHKVPNFLPVGRPKGSRTRSGWRGDWNWYRSTTRRLLHPMRNPSRDSASSCAVSRCPTPSSCCLRIRNQPLLQPSQAESRSREGAHHWMPGKQVSRSRPQHVICR